MTLFRPALPLLLLGALGCAAESGDVAIDPTLLVVAEGLPIAGNPVVLEAPWIAEMPEGFELQIDDRPPFPILRDSSRNDRVRIELPEDLAPGSHLLRSPSPAAAGAVVGMITTGGISEFRSVGGRFSGAVQLVPVLPGLIGTAEMPIEGIPTFVPVVLDARLGTYAPLPGTTTEPSGIGSSYETGRYLLYHPWSGGYWLRIGSSLGGLVVDSLPIEGSTYPTHELAQGLYLQDMKHQSLVRDLAPDATLDYAWLSLAVAEGVAYSPDGKWAVLSHNVSSLGLAIFDRQARTLQWGAGWTAMTRPLFLADGQLIVYGERKSETDTVARLMLAQVDAETGMVQDSVEVAATQYDLNPPAALTIRDWIVIPEHRDDEIVLSIRDPHDLKELASVKLLTGGPSWVGHRRLMIIEDPTLDRFYLTANYSNTSIPLWTFQPPPE